MYFGRLYVIITLMALVWANTETLRVTLAEAGSQASGHAQYTLSPERPRARLSVKPEFTFSHQQFQLSRSFASGDYEIRISWPASSPLEFQLAFDAPNQIVDIKYRSDYYSHIPSLMSEPLEAPFEIAVDRVVMGLPGDLVGVVLLAVVGGGIAWLASGGVYKYIANH